MFERVALNLGKSYLLPRPVNRTGRPYGKAPYYLASFKKEFSSKSLPLGYRWPSSRPQPLVDCDAEACHQPSQSKIQRLSCGHTFHFPCMSDRDGNSLGCIICLPNLISDIQKLSQSWNKGLLSGIDNDDDGGEGDDNNSNSDDDDDDDKSNDLLKPKEKDNKYFNSPLFVKNIQEKVEKIKSAVNFQATLSHEE